jgi:hypothetical protein
MFIELVWKDLRRVDEYQIKIVLAKTTDLLPVRPESYSNIEMTIL